jgi:hypothetical protein
MAAPEGTASRATDAGQQEPAAGTAQDAEETGGLGHPGRPLNLRSPFFVGLAGAAGVAVTYGIAELIIKARSVLVLIGLALFLAVGLEAR